MDKYRFSTAWPSKMYTFGAKARNFLFRSVNQSIAHTRNRSPGYFFTIVNRYMALLEKRLHSITITTVQYQVVPHVHPNPHKTLPAGFCTNKTASDLAAISIAHEKKNLPKTQHKSSAIYFSCKSTSK